MKPRYFSLELMYNNLNIPPLISHAAVKFLRLGFTHLYFNDSLGRVIWLSDFCDIRLWFFLFNLRLNLE